MLTFKTVPTFSTCCIMSQIGKCKTSTIKFNETIYKLISHFLANALPTCTGGHASPLISMKQYFPSIQVVTLSHYCIRHSMIFSLGCSKSLFPFILPIAVMFSSSPLLITYLMNFNFFVKLTVFFSL